MGISRATAYKWLRRFRQEGVNGLQDRSSRPHLCPHRLDRQLEARIVAIRRECRKGPLWIALQLGLHASTVGRVLRRHQLPLLSHLDPATGVLIRGRRASAQRYEYDAPGGLIHVDVKKLGKIPPGGGWRIHGRSEQVRGRGNGYDYVHSAVDDHSRLAYSEILNSERAQDCAGFLSRALTFFAAHGVAVDRVMTDNAFSYRHSRAWKQVLADRGVRQIFIKPHCPWTNGKVERFNRTLQTEWAYRQPFTSNDQRRAALPEWLAYYNTRRSHTALSNKPPISRLTVNDLLGHYS
jgi:transposase InsO family protein